MINRKSVLNVKKCSPKRYNSLDKKTSFILKVLIAHFAAFYKLFNRASYLHIVCRSHFIGGRIRVYLGVLVSWSKGALNLLRPMIVWWLFNEWLKRERCIIIWLHLIILFSRCLDDCSFQQTITHHT